jgi:hypothetical protein
MLVTPTEPCSRRDSSNIPRALVNNVLSYREDGRRCNNAISLDARNWSKLHKLGLARSLNSNVDITHHHHFSQNIKYPTMARLSGLQRDVLSLYRQCLRAVREKPEVR